MPIQSRCFISFCILSSRSFKISVFLALNTNITKNLTPTTSLMDCKLTSFNLLSTPPKSSPSLSKTVPMLSTTLSMVGSLLLLLSQLFVKGRDPTKKPIILFKAPLTTDSKKRKASTSKARKDHLWKTIDCKHSRLNSRESSNRERQNKIYNFRSLLPNKGQNLMTAVPFLPIAASGFLVNFSQRESSTDRRVLY